mmetsp:Transcript_8825/g.12888  ORF Transcript_8825/g.12888 Transcript_8825/m.12888 type:complete len:96 (-) Transcript_8825:276-563(-)
MCNKIRARENVGKLQEAQFHRALSHNIHTDIQKQSETTTNLRHYSLPEESFSSDKSFSESPLTKAAEASVTSGLPPDPFPAVGSLGLPTRGFPGL